MIDIVFPNGDENIFEDISNKLNIILCRVYYKESKNKGNIILVKNVSEIKKSSGKLFIGKGADNSRELLENPNICLVFGVEDDIKKDSLHYRKSGLNQVLCKIAARKEKMIGFDIGSLLRANDIQRKILMGRMSQNIIMCRKYKINMVLGSFATNPHEMRAESDLQSFGIILGMTQVEAKNATCNFKEFLQHQ